MVTQQLLSYSHAPITTNPILREGDTGAAVAELQTLLNAKGLRLTVDGIFSRQTTAIVRQFQKQHNLPTDGMVGCFTWAALRRPTASPIHLANVCLLYDPYRYPHQTHAINWLSNQINSATLREFLQRWENAAIVAEPVLQIGSWGANVQKLQNRLNRIGAKLVEDGDFGPMTQAIVKQFQKHRRLVATGIVDEETWVKLWQMAEKRHLNELFYNYQSRYKSQTAALEWLQQQLPVDILEEFSMRWRNLPTVRMAIA